AKARASSMLDEARQRSQSIVDTVTKHTKDVLRDAEDRTRSLRYQQTQLNGFMAEVQSLMHVADAADPRTWGSAGSEARSEPGDAVADASTSSSAQAAVPSVAAEDRVV